MFFPSSAVFAAGVDMGACPGNANADDRDLTERGLRDARHKSSVWQVVRASAIDAGPRSFAPQEYLSTAFLSLIDGVAPIRAPVDDVAFIGEDPLEPFGYAQDVAIGTGQGVSDSFAACSIRFCPIGVPGAYAEEARAAFRAHDRNLCATLGRRNNRYAETARSRQGTDVWLRDGLGLVRFGHGGVWRHRACRRAAHDAQGAAAHDEPRSPRNMSA